MKGILVCILALACLGLSVVFQPWAELGFGGMDKSDITTAPMLSGPLHALCDAYSGLGGLGQSLRTQVVNKLDEEAKLNGGTPDPAWNKPVKAGNYAYAYFMSFAMVAAAIAIILIGREDAEEKLVLPLGKK